MQDHIDIIPKRMHQNIKYIGGRLGFRKRLFCMDFGEISFCLFNFGFLDIVILNDHKFLNFSLRLAKRLTVT